MDEPRRADGYTEPRLAEIEAARLLSNEHRDELRSMGLDDEQIRKLADDYTAQTDGDPAAFLAWARQRAKKQDVP